MVNEAQLRDRLEHPIDFTVADGTGIEKGTVLAMTDPRTAIAASSAAEVLAGIAAREKIASDGRTRLAVFRRGIFDMIASGSIAVGEPVYSTGTLNSVVTAKATNISGAAILGHALETASDTEVVQIFVNIGGGNGK